MSKKSKQTHQEIVEDLLRDAVEILIETFREDLPDDLEREAVHVISRYYGLMGHNSSQMIKEFMACDIDLEDE